MRLELLPLAAAPLLAITVANAPTHEPRVVDTAAPAAAIIPPHAGARAPSFELRGLLAAQNLCSIKAPPPAQEDTLKPKDGEPADWGPKPQPPAEVDELIARGKLKDAAKELDGWARYEIRAREKTAMEIANRGDGPDGPSPQIREMLYIERLVVDQYQARLGLSGDYGALPSAGRIAGRWADVRIPRLWSEGKALAAAGGPEYPPQAREIVAIGKSALSVNAQMKNGRALDHIGTASDVYDTWATVRVKQLEDQGMAEAEKAQREPPPQGRELMAISKQRALVGTAGGNLSGREQGIARQILGKWADLRVSKLEPQGVEKAKAGGAAPPEDEILALMDVQRAISSLSDGMDGRGPHAMAAVGSIVSEWTKARLAPLIQTGNAAATGAAETPPQVDEIVQFAQDNNCLGLEQTSFRKDTENAARAIGELNLQRYRDRLECPVADAKKAVVAKLAGDLEKHGWGPYDRSFGCDWSGTITITTIRHEVDTAVYRNNSGTITEESTFQDTTVYRVAVDGGTGNARWEGRRRSHILGRGTGCAPDTTLAAATTTEAGSATIGVQIRAPNLINEATIAFPNIPLRVTTTSVKSGSGQRCGYGPRYNDSDTQTYEMPATMPGVLFRTKPPGVVTEGQRAFIELAGADTTRTPEFTVIQEWKLRKRR